MGVSGVRVSPKGSINSPGIAYRPQHHPEKVIRWVLGLGECVAGGIGGDGEREGRRPPCQEWMRVLSEDILQAITWGVSILFLW